MQEEKTVNNMKKEQLRLYAVTDRRWLHGKTLTEAVRESLAGGVTFVQIREKNLDASPRSADQQPAFSAQG